MNPIHNGRKTVQLSELLHYMITLVLGQGSIYALTLVSCNSIQHFIGLIMLHSTTTNWPAMNRVHSYRKTVEVSKLLHDTMSTVQLLGSIYARTLVNSHNCQCCQIRLDIFLNGSVVLVCYCFVSIPAPNCARARDRCFTHKNGKKLDQIYVILSGKTVIQNYLFTFLLLKLRLLVKLFQQTWKISLVPLVH